jgi:hypothetical protein
MQKKEYIPRQYKYIKYWEQLQQYKLYLAARNPASSA